MKIPEVMGLESRPCSPRTLFISSAGILYSRTVDRPGFQMPLAIMPSDRFSLCHMADAFVSALDYRFTYLLSLVGEILLSANGVLALEERNCLSVMHMCRFLSMTLANVLV